MRTRITNRFCSVVSIIAGLLLAGCQGASVEVEEVESELTIIPRADVYLSEELGVAYEDLARAYENYHDLPENSINFAMSVGSRSSFSDQVQYIPSVYESVEPSNLSYWVDSINVAEATLLKSKLQAGNRLLDDAVEAGVTSEDQAMMAFYTNVIDQASSNPSLWASAVGVTEEELERFTRSGLTYEAIATQNGLRITEVYEEIYKNYLAMLDPEWESLIIFDQDQFADYYKPATGGCFGSNFSSELVDEPEDFIPFIPVAQATACPVFHNIRPCSPEECGYGEDGPKGPITIDVGIGGRPITPGDGGMRGEYAPANGEFKPDFELGTFVMTHDDLERVKNGCDMKKMLLLITNIGGEHNLEFYYDSNKNKTRDGNEEVKRTITTTAGTNIYVCATYYINVELRFRDTKGRSTTSFYCNMPRVDGDYMSCKEMLN